MDNRRFPRNRMSLMQRLEGERPLRDRDQVQHPGDLYVGLVIQVRIIGQNPYEVVVTSNPFYDELGFLVVAVKRLRNAYKEELLILSSFSVVRGKNGWAENHLVCHPEAFTPDELDFFGFIDEDTVSYDPALINFRLEPEPGEDDTAPVVPAYDGHFEVEDFENINNSNRWPPFI